MTTKTIRRGRNLTFFGRRARKLVMEHLLQLLENIAMINEIKWAQ